MEFDVLSSKVIKCALAVHKELGSGLLENVYSKALEYELEESKIEYDSEVEVPVFYKGSRLPCNYRIDLIINESIIVEVKSVEHIIPVHWAQLLTYMKLTSKRIGLLFNFNQPRLFIKRMVL
jgi:GxxExxY protein